MLAEGALGVGGVINGDIGKGPSKDTEVVDGHAASTSPAWNSLNQRRYRRMQAVRHTCASLAPENPAPVGGVDGARKRGQSRLTGVCGGLNVATVT